MAPTFQPVQSLAEIRNHLQHAPQQVERVVQSPWLTTDEACAYLRFEGKWKLRSLYRFLKVNGVPTARRSRMRLLIARADLEQALLGTGGARRRRALTA